MYLTIDVGGTKTLLALFDADGTVTQQIKFPTPLEYVDFIQQLRHEISGMLAESQPTACAIALPATLDRDRGIALFFGNLPWIDIPIVENLRPVLSCPIYIENDAKLAGLAEADAVKELYHRVLYVTVSTGIGLGLTVDGKIDYTVHDAGGRGLLMEHDGKLMAWEEFASGKAIVAQTGKMASEITDSRDWYVIARNIAIGLIDLIVTLSPDCIVIGGGVGTHLDKFHEHLHEQLELYRNKMLTTMPQIMKAKHPEEAVIYGGYLLCKQHEKHQ